MPIKLANNASGTLATAISASDTGVALTTGNGALFPTLAAGEYFYATLTSSANTQEIVKATARSGDSLTIVRAQEGTAAQSFAAGARFELRVTTKSITDTIYDITRYQGASATNPTVRLNGEPLIVGDFYFNTGDNSLRFYNGSAWQSVVSGSITIQQFSGNGVSTVFTFSTAPSVEAVTQVYINGVYQQKDTYALVGAVLTFSQAPVAGTGNIEVVVIEAVAIGTLASSSVTHSAAVTSLLTATDAKNALDDLSHSSTGSTKVGFLQSGTGATSRTVQAKLRESVSVLDFGAVGDGTTDDTAAIQAAIDAVTGSGGRVIFPVPGIYKVTSQITVTSSHPVVLESWMGPNNASSPASYISIGAAISGAVFDISSRGGCVRGLWFRDPTSSLGVSQGTRAINQALKLTVFGMGTVENCSFDGLLGSAIETVNMIRGRILNPHIRDCGTPSRPVIYLNGTSAGVPSQAVTIFSPHIETCYGQYIHINQHSPDTKIVAGQFEADTSIAATCLYFIYNNGDRTKIESCGFNRNTATAFYGNSNRAQISNSSFNAASGAVTAPRVHLIGSFNQVTGCLFSGTSADTGTSINDAGGNNFFTGCHVYFGGNVILGASSVWSGGGCFDLQTTQTYAMNCGANSTVTGAFVSGSDVAGGILAIGGVTVTGCNVTSNAGIGIRCQSSTATIIGNRASGNTGGDYSFTAYPHGYSTNANHAGDGVYPLQAETTWNPGSLANGASESVNVTVTGAAVGDFPDAQFPMLVAASGQNGMQLSASVYATNSVKVTITNNSGGVVDLDSGTLRVKVMKQ